MTARHRLRSLIVFLFLGAIINVAVAWGFGLSGDPQLEASLGGGDYGGNEAYWEYTVARGWGTTVVTRTGGLRTFRCDPNSDWARNAPAGYFTRFPAPVPPTPCLLPWWSSARSACPTTFPFDNDPVLEVACGWPLRSVLCELREQVPRYLIPVGGGIAVSGTRFDGRRLRMLPIEPIPAGFATNTVLYAAIAWLATGGLKRWQHAWRIRHRLCPTCAYPVGTSDLCTECGKPRPVTR